MRATAHEPTEAALGVLCALGSVLGTEYRWTVASEVADEIGGITTGSVSSYLRWLERDGYVERSSRYDGRSWRGITSMGWDWLETLEDADGGTK